MPSQDAEAAQETPSDRYRMVAAAIRFIEARAEAGEQPRLADVAAQVGLSAPHFQRVFSEWVGVSPKKYLAYLTLDHAKRLLRERRSVLDASLEAGLSGPSRLHDLFVTWEAMTPGAYATGGGGLTIRFGWFDTPFGEALAMGSDLGLCGLAFTVDCGRDAAFRDLTCRWPAARFVEDGAALRDVIAAAFAPRRDAPLKLTLIGAPFQVKVWEALLQIPSGMVATYSDVAAAAGNPKAVRAVGTAIGRNPIAWIIPCHRALRKSGGLGGYHWGLGVKKAMLAYEAARAEAAEAPRAQAMGRR